MFGLKIVCLFLFVLFIVSFGTTFNFHLIRGCGLMLFGLRIAVLMGLRGYLLFGGWFAFLWLLALLWFCC